MATAARQLPDWGTEPPRYPTAHKLALGAILLGPLLVLFTLPLLFEGAVSVAITAGGSLLLVAFWVLTYRKVAGRALRNARAEPLTDARFENLVRGLAVDHGLPIPRLLVLPEGGPNALTLGGRDPAIAVTRSMLESFTRTEQEAVAAHCLLRIARGDLAFAQLAAVLGRSGNRFAPRVGFEDDVQAAAVTRYPPGLAAAIGKAKPAEDDFAALWFVAHDATHRPARDRIAALQDL